MPIPNDDRDLRIARAGESRIRPASIHRLGESEWSVESAGGAAAYRVRFDGPNGECTCPDYSLRNLPCKHVYLVLGILLKEAGQALAPPILPPRKQYPQHPSYTRGQTEEMRLFEKLLRGLVDTIEDLPRAPGTPGRTPLGLNDSIYCAILKVYSGLSGRRAHGVHQNAADRGLLEFAPSYVVASRTLNRPETQAILNRLLALSAEPLAALEEGEAVAPDSTGIQSTWFGGWRERRFGERREKRWLKVHAMVGTKTHVIIKAIVSEGHSGDAPEFGPLLRGTLENGFRPGSVTADKGYLSRENYRLAAELGIPAYIPFKVDSTTKSRKRRSNPAWRRAFHMFQANREEFDRNYHRRSNVEAAFSALKRKFGENIRSKTTIAQVNEVLCKLIAYNLTVVVREMFENGIAPSFLSGPAGEQEGVGAAS